MKKSRTINYNFIDDLLISRVWIIPDCLLFTPSGAPDQSKFLFYISLKILNTSWGKQCKIIIPENTIKRVFILYGISLFVCVFVTLQITCSFIHNPKSPVPTFIIQGHLLEALTIHKVTCFILELLPFIIWSHWLLYASTIIYPRSPVYLFLNNYVSWC